MKCEHTVCKLMSTDNLSPRVIRELANICIVPLTVTSVSYGALRILKRAGENTSYEANLIAFIDYYKII